MTTNGMILREGFSENGPVDVVVREAEWIAAGHRLDGETEPTTEYLRRAADDAARRGVVGIV